MSETSGTFSIRLDPKLLAKIEAQAKKEDRSTNYIIVKRLEQSFTMKGK